MNKNTKQNFEQESDLLKEMKKLKSQNLTYEEIGQQVGVCHQTVRNHLDQDKPKRRYTRTIRCVNKGTVLKSKENIAIKELKSENLRLQNELKKSHQSLSKHLDEKDKLIKQNGDYYTKMKTLEEQNKKLKKEGYQTPELVRSIQNDLLRQLEDQHFELARKNTDTNKLEFTQLSIFKR